MSSDGGDVREPALESEPQSQSQAQPLAQREYRPTHEFVNVAEDDADGLAAYGRANVAQAQDILAVIEKVKVKQDEWQTVLACAMAQELEEERACNALFRRVQVSQMRNLESAEFERWLDTKTLVGGGGGGGAGAAGEDAKSKVRIGTARIERWYHDELLIGASPYAAVVPLPRNLSGAGRDEAAATIDGLGLPAGAIHVENFPFDAISIVGAAQALGVLAAGASGSAEQREANAANFQYLAASHATGAAVLAAVDANPVLKAALEATPCLFLNDRGGPAGTSSAGRLAAAAATGDAAAPAPAPATGLFRCIVVGGQFVAAEGATSAFLRGAAPADRRDPFATAACEAALSAFVQGLVQPPASSLHDRSVQLVVLGVLRPDPSPAPAPAAPAPAFYLLDVAPFSGADTDFFKLQELLLLAEYRHTLLHSRGAGSPALVRIAGAPWQPINAVVKDGVLRRGSDGGSAEKEGKEGSGAPASAGFSARAVVLLSLGTAVAAAAIATVAVSKALRRE